MISSEIILVILTELPFSFQNLSMIKEDKWRVNHQSINSEGMKTQSTATAGVKEHFSLEDKAAIKNGEANFSELQHIQVYYRIAKFLYNQFPGRYRIGFFRAQEIILAK